LKTTAKNAAHNVIATNTNTNLLADLKIVDINLYYWLKNGKKFPIAVTTAFTVNAICRLINVCDISNYLDQVIG